MRGEEKKNQTSKETWAEKVKAVIFVQFCIPVQKIFGRELILFLKGKGKTEIASVFNLGIPKSSQHSSFNNLAKGMR